MMFKGKKILIMGVSDGQSIAWDLAVQLHE